MFSDDRWTCRHCNHSVITPITMPWVARPHYLNQARDHHIHVCPALAWGRTSR